MRLLRTDHGDGVSVITCADPTQRDVRNLRRRAYNHGRTVRDQVHVEALRMMAGRVEVRAIEAHLVLALTAEGVAP